MKHWITKIIWYFLKDKCVIESGKHIVSNLPWFKIYIFGEKIVQIDYKEWEIMRMR